VSGVIGGLVVLVAVVAYADLVGFLDERRGRG
jgi:hypothetical protein